MTTKTNKRLKNFTTNQATADKLDVLSDIVSGYKSTQVENCLRTVFAKHIKAILEIHSKHGSKTALSKYLRTKGLQTTSRTLHRILSDNTENKLLVNERTGLIILRHTIDFFEIAPEVQDTICTDIIDTYAKFIYSLNVVCFGIY